MNKPLKLSCNKNHIVKCLLAIIMVLSLFNFGGISAAQERPQIYHTALQANSGYKVKKSVTYHCPFCQPRANTFFSGLSLVNDLSCLHSNLAKIQLIEHSVPYIVVKPLSYFYRTITPGITGDDPAIQV
ncbi:hypothetical protein [Mucilaginibacter ginsenosidivorans]|uniref:Uncharacterized protein n=1 Tax=Mucilaginibacter ginsenosidivorans TaxID=398053 RepID=A0A5B8V085_9SPHI|nr:hypothetical protein [Mucilaginibacter ginsenosidivorans]QEC64243.1 hypothetical protein FRZ54_17210 [Mucilaginibacter ginsenosidivorans]